jgi:hypothetical protein
LEKDVNRKKIKAGPGKQWVEGKDFRLAKEIKYIQRRAAEHGGRFVTIGPLALFSTETGDAWILDPSDQLAARLARDGDPEPIDFEETDTNFAIGWKGNYRIEGRASCTQTESRGASLRSLAIPPPRLHNWAKLEKLVRRCPAKRKSPACLPNKVPKAFAG